MSEIGPPYQVREEPQFRRDCELIHPDAATFDVLFAAIQFILERAPYLHARSLNEEGRFWIRRFNSHATEDGLQMPAVIVSYEIVRNPPNGLIALHHVRTPEDVQAGIFEDDGETIPV